MMGAPPLKNDTRLATAKRVMKGKHPRFIGGHVARVPSDLPTELEVHGPCLCTDCASSDAGEGVAWRRPPRDKSTRARAVRRDVARSHTEDWRRLSWCVGDAAADWICGWCDREPHPDIAIDAILTIAEFDHHLTDAVNVEPARRRIWRYITEMVRTRP